MRPRPKGNEFDPAVPSREALSREALYPAAHGAPWSRPELEVARDMGVDPGVGLSEAEVALRRAAAGPNELHAEPPRTLLRSMLAQLRETMILVLLGAAVLTAAIGDLADSAVILIVIAVNTAVGVLQERRAIGAVAALRALTTPTSTVWRGAELHRVPTTELVPGDVLHISEGDVAGADARLLTSHALQIDESLLTGESNPVDRDADATCPPTAPTADRTTMLHGGSIVVHGSGTAVVVATGSGTELGRIATMLRERAAPATPLQRRLAALERRLSLAAVLGCGLVVGLGLLRGESWELMLVAGISLAVAVIPESLPAVVALALAAATRRMAAQGAIVRSPPAVEALGSVTVLATDKTGTLTTGSTACVALWTRESGELDLAASPVTGEGVVAGRGPRALLEASALCNDARPGAPGTEGALAGAAAAAGIDVAALRGDPPPHARRPLRRHSPVDVHRARRTGRHPGSGQGRPGGRADRGDRRCRCGGRAADRAGTARARRLGLPARGAAAAGAGRAGRPRPDRTPGTRCWPRAGPASAPS